VRPYSNNPDEVLSVDFKNVVGGFMGIGKSETRAKIKFTEN